MTQAFLHIHSDMYQNVLEHLLEQSDDREAAGFMFVNSETQDDDSVFRGRRVVSCSRRRIPGGD